MLAGQAVMINWSDVAPGDRPAYYELHSSEHMVGRVAIPGFQRGRRYIATRAQRDFLAGAARLRECHRTGDLKPEARRLKNAPLGDCRT